MDTEATVDIESTEPVVETTDTGTLDTEITEPVGDSVTEPGSETEPTYYTVKVGGAEQQVTLEDLQSGFMRQADYTRKTQEVAQLRQRLAHAEAIANSLEADPQGTLRALAEAFGVGIDTDSGEFDEPDPLDQRLRALEAREQAAQAQQVRAQIDQEIDTLLNTYGDFDLQEVINHAATNGMTVTAAYRDIHFDQLVSKQKETERITQSKREAGVVEGGAHRAGVVQQEKPAGSIREAWRQAQRTLGVGA